jgi:hypothetical protein
MNKQDFIIVYISLVLTITQFYWMRAEKRAAWLEGHQAAFTELSNQEDGQGFKCK